MAKDDDTATTEAAVTDDTKAKFREALERKKSNQHRTADGSTNTGQVHGSETAGPSQRKGSSTSPTPLRMRRTSKRCRFTISWPAT